MHACNHEDFYSYGNKEFFLWTDFYKLKAQFKNVLDSSKAHQACSNQGTSKKILEKWLKNQKTKNWQLSDLEKSGPKKGFKAQIEKGQRVWAQHQFQGPRSIMETRKKENQYLANVNLGS